LFIRIADSGRLRFAAGFTSALILLAVLAFSVSLAVAGTTNVTMSKSSNASEPVQPGASFTYTLSGNVATLPVTNLTVKDGSIDDPQVSVTTATWSVSGGGSGSCNVGPIPSNVSCSIGSVPASTSGEENASSKSKQRNPHDANLLAAAQ
jgi:hypothetical protein